ncbi:MAG: NIL domain-containing protein [Anaerolineales bacterium]|nr:NIL domain-containing protein [Anaerolineales bacterium]
MATILLLNYPPALVSRPVVASLISMFHLEVNILRAQVTREEGWLIVEIDGDPRQLSAARDWLAKEGIEVIEDPDLDAGG